MEGNMRIFKLDGVYNVVCESLPTRSGFKHTAHLIKNDYSEVYTTKINYYNRTWECYEYESILIKVVTSYFKDKDKNNFLDIVKNFR
jgi:hypothetical protein